MAPARPTGRSANGPVGSGTPSHSWASTGPRPADRPTGRWHGLALSRILGQLPHGPRCHQPLVPGTVRQCQPARSGRVTWPHGHMATCSRRPSRASARECLTVQTPADRGESPPLPSASKCQGVPTPGVTWPHGHMLTGSVGPSRRERIRVSDTDNPKVPTGQSANGPSRSWHGLAFSGIRPPYLPACQAVNALISVLAVLARFPGAALA
jgi:hypothetical protein